MGQGQTIIIQQVTIFFFWLRLKFKISTKTRARVEFQINTHHGEGAHWGESMQKTGSQTRCWAGAQWSSGGTGDFFLTAPRPLCVQFQNEKRPTSQPEALLDEGFHGRWLWLAPWHLVWGRKKYTWCVPRRHCERQGWALQRQDQTQCQGEAVCKNNIIHYLHK